MTTLTLPISGMTCANCAARVEKALAAVPGVVTASVNLATEKATVAGAALPEALVAAVERAGYGATLVATSAGPNRDQILVIGGALLSLPLLAAMIWPVPGWVQAVLATVIQVVLGFGFYVAAFKALRARAAP